MKYRYSGYIHIVPAAKTPKMLVSAPDSLRVKRYDQLSNELRQRILDGELKPGDKLPTFIELRQQYGVSQSTWDRAQSALEMEGLVLRKRGAGTFVSESSPRAASDGFEAAATKSSFLNRSVVVLTPFGQPGGAHQSHGWLEWIGQGAVDAVQGAGRHIVTLHPDTATEELEQLVRERPFGVLVSAVWEEKSIYSDLVRKLVAARIPVVTFGGDPQELGCDCVLSDHEQGAYELTRLLISHGRKRVLSVAPNTNNSSWFAARYAGYGRAMREAGLETLAPLPLPFQQTLRSLARLAMQNGLPASSAPTPEEVFCHNVKVSTGYFVESLTGANRVDALMMPSDGSLFVAAAIGRMLGLDPNRDVLIAGYDNFFSECDERLIEPFVPFATVDKNNVEIGKAMTQLLMERVDGVLPSQLQSRFIAPTLLPLG